MNDDKRLALGEEMTRMLGDTVDLRQPDHRIAATLFVVLKNQLELLGYAPGTVPFDARFGSEKCRGALLGTAFAAVRGHREAPEREHYIDGVASAFTLVFGAEVGSARAAQTIEDSGNGNAAVNSAADRAGQDMIDNWSDDTPTAPMAFYQAATGAF